MVSDPDQRKGLSVVDDDDESTSPDYSQDILRD